MVVANAGDGVHAGSVSIISIPLCSANAQPTNPNCDPNNPVDAVGFGTVLATVPVGHQSPHGWRSAGSARRAYVVNGGNPNLPCAAPIQSQPLGNCTVSVINLTTNTVTATIPIPRLDRSAANSINGHPNYIAVTTGTPTGKVYVTSPESNFMTVIRTDTDTVLTSPSRSRATASRFASPSPETIHRCRVNQYSQSKAERAIRSEDGSFLCLLSNPDCAHSPARMIGRVGVVAPPSSSTVTPNAFASTPFGSGGRITLALPRCIRLERPCGNRSSRPPRRNQPQLIGLRRLQRLQIARQKDQRALARNIRCSVPAEQEFVLPFVFSVTRIAADCRSSCPSPAAPPQHPPSAGQWCSSAPRSRCACLARPRARWYRLPAVTASPAASAHPSTATLCRHLRFGAYSPRSHNCAASKPATR